MFVAVSLSPMFPETRMLGMEIRVKVSDFVTDKIRGLREQHPGQYNNIACVRTNAMKYLPNYFYKGQVCKNELKIIHKSHYKKKLCPTYYLILTLILSS